MYPGGHPQRIWPVATDILKPVAGVGARQAAQRHQPRHEAYVGIVFAGLNQLVHLVEAGEVVSRLGGGLLERLLRTALAGEHVPDRKPLALASLPLHGFPFP